MGFAQIRAAAEMHYNNNNYSYKDLSSNPNWKNIETYINDNSPGSAVIYDSRDNYCAYSMLNIEDDGIQKYYCVYNSIEVSTVIENPGDGYCTGLVFGCPDK